MQKEAEKSKKMQCQTDRSSNVNYAWDELSTKGSTDFFSWTRDGRKQKELLQMQVLMNAWNIIRHQPIDNNDLSTLKFWLD